MPITSETIIHSIHTKLDALLVAAGGSAIPYGIGAIAKNKHGVAPRIIWSDENAQGSFVPLRRTGKDRKRWAEDVDRWNVQIWCTETIAIDGLTARSNCQLMAHNLVKAARSEVGAERGYGVETVLFGGYEKTRDRQLKKGMVLTVEAEIRLNVTDDVWGTPLVTEIDGTGILIPTGETPFEITAREYTTEFSTEFTA